MAGPKSMPRRRASSATARNGDRSSSAFSSVGATATSRAAAFGDLDNDGFLCTVECNDQDPAVFPSATEICGDGIDNDCDGKTDGADKGSCNKDPAC